MKIVLATGIALPEIGGPATYVDALAKELLRRGQDVTVLTFAHGVRGGIERSEGGGTPMVRVSRLGGPIMRWRRYAAALRMYADDADVVLAFSSISVGLPLRMAKLKKPYRVLRVGGDYFWERYTAMGGMRTLREWYRSRPSKAKLTVQDRIAYRLTRRLNLVFLRPLLPSFHHIAFTTAFQEHLYKLAYPGVDRHSVIQNAFPALQVPEDVPYAAREDELTQRPVRLLFFGRLVGFKNLFALLRAVSRLPHVRLSIVGEGPLLAGLKAEAQKLMIIDRVSFQSPKGPTEKRAVFHDHDVMVIPSITEISPNAALEARAVGMPVLLSEETGLSPELTNGMVLKNLREPEDIARAVLEVEQNYAEIAQAAREPLPERSWEQVADEWVALFEGFMPRSESSISRES